MDYRYQTEILSHVVSVSMDYSRRYRIAIDGPRVWAESVRTFLTLHEAKSEAHLFTHCVLREGCDCNGVAWSIIIPDRQTPPTPPLASMPQRRTAAQVPHLNMSAIAGAGSSVEP